MAKIPLRHENDTDPVPRGLIRAADLLARQRAQIGDSRAERDQLLTQTPSDLRWPCRAGLHATYSDGSGAVLDGAIATVRNSRWRKVICAESLESSSLETKQPA